MVAASSTGHSGAASAPWEHVLRHFAVAALFVARNAACTSGGPKIDSHVDFDATTTATLILRADPSYPTVALFHVSLTLRKILKRRAA